MFDPTQNAWLAHGEGVDAATAIGNTLYVFRGSQYITIDLTTNITASDPIAIATTWPTLPDSFKLGVNGAANVGGKLMLFNGGWFVMADGSSPRKKLTAIKTWPQTANWVDGLIDAVFYTGHAVNVDVSEVLLFRNGEYILVHFFDIDGLLFQSVGLGPLPAQSRLPPSLATTGTDAASVIPVSNDTVYFQSTSVVVVPPSGGAGITYCLPALFTQWPVTWNPVLNHAPSGRVGNLWCATKAQGIVRHDGGQWSVMPGGGNTASVGQDGMVMVTSASGLYRWNGNGYDGLGGANLLQVSVGDANHVWVRESNNTVNSYDTTRGFAPVNLGPGVPAPTHMVANADGTLWHCNSGNPNAFRLISEANLPSAQIQLKGAGLITSVQKVASTGFGAAHCLAQHSDGSTVVYEYDSPYIFKTANSYQALTIVKGLTNLYVISQDDFGSPQIYVAAIDAHTGREVARSQPLTFNPTMYRGLVFDPVNELIYASISLPFDNGNNDNNNTTSGAVVALDARTLVQRWSFATPSGVDAAPALNGTTLVFGDRNGTLYAFDTRAALANAPSPQPKWTWKVPTAPITAAATHRIATPLFAQGRIFAATWAIGFIYPGSNEVVNGLWLAECNQDGTGQNVTFKDYKDDFQDFIPAIILTAPVLGRIKTTVATSPAVFINGWDAVDVQTTDGSTPVKASFALPSANQFLVTGFGYDDGQRTAPVANVSASLWFSDNVGYLYALDETLSPVHGTPYYAGIGSSGNGTLSIPVTTPRLYVDSAGTLSAFYGMYGQEAVENLYIYSEGNLATIPTGATQITSLTPISNGVLYLAGGQPNSAFGNLIAQVFGVRVDTLTQVLRDFIIESQMLQDPDENAPGGDPSNAQNPIPPSRARYQTHLTIVDDLKNPIPNEAVKIWADAATTLLINGTSYAIGPGDTQFASLKTGADGALVMTSGYSKADGSDTPDMYAPALRVWANFMDTYERIIVHQDYEFHGRIATAHTNATDDDPDKVNLTTTQSYAGTNNSATPALLFSSDEQKAGQATNCATAISQMKSGVGFGGGGETNSTRALFGKLMLHTSGRKQAHRTMRRALTTAQSANAVAVAPPRYVAYTDLAGSGYFPTNIPAPRPSTVVQPTGLVFNKPQNQPATAIKLQVVHHADAQAAFDALPPATINPLWQKAPPGSVQRADGVYVIQGTQNIFTDFWNWLKGVVAEITDLIVTIADEVMVGIRLFVNGVEQVFKAIVKVLDDIASAIGSFFAMLAKLIEDVIAALSVLFHFGEIMWTHRWLAAQFQSQVKQLTASIQTQAMPQVEQFFTKGENAVKTAFDSIRKSIGASNSVDDVKGMGATPHTVFTAGPGKVGPNSGGSSHSTQCAWGIQKFKSGSSSATSSPSLLAQINGPVHGPSQTLDDPLSAFFTAFVARLNNNADLGSVFSQLKSDFGNLFHANSAKQFFSTFLTTLLDLVEAIVIGVMAVGEALVEGILGVAQAAIDAIMAVLNFEIEIPVITWLYKTLFNEKLTFLNLATLVAAIPVTILFRVIEGKYPSQAGLPTATALVEEQRLAQVSGVTKAAPKVAQQVLATFTGVFAIVQGICNGIGDAEGDDAPPITGVLSAGLGLLITVFTVPAITADTPSEEDWLVFGISAAWALTDALALPNFNLADQAVLPWCNSGMGLLVLICTIIAFVEDGNTDVISDIGFAGGIASAIPGVLNAVKLAPEPAALVVGVVDVIGGVVSGFIDILVAYASVGSALPAYRLHIPMMHNAAPIGFPLAN